MSAIDDLEAINDSLATWIIHTSPALTDTVGIANMQQAISLHNQLDQLQTKLQLIDLEKVNKALLALLDKQGPLLTTLTGKISQVAKDISTAESVISWAAQAIAVAAQIAALAAGA